MGTSSALLLMMTWQFFATSSCNNNNNCGTGLANMELGFLEPIGGVQASGTIVGLAHSRKFDDVIYFITETSNTVYAVNAKTTGIIGSITMTDATNVDWGDLAVGECTTGTPGSCIYVHDGGSGRAASERTIYIVKEQSNPATNVNVQANRIITYEFLPGNEMKKSRSIFVDCQRNIYIIEFSSYRASSKTLYQIKDADGKPTAVGVFLMTIPSTDDGPVSASLSEDCSGLLVKTHDKVYYFPILNDRVEVSLMKLLPYLPNKVEEAITWGRQNDRYYIIEKNDPFTLKVAKETQQSARSKFGRGVVLGTIDTDVIDNINGLAVSRRRPGFAYAVTRIRKYEVLILQLHGVETVGRITTGITSTSMSLLDIATGSCPSSFVKPNCIYMNSHDSRATPDTKVYVFEEPDRLYGQTVVTLGTENILEYSLPPGYLGVPQGIMIGRTGEIYFTEYDGKEGTIAVFQFNGVTNKLNPLTTFKGLSLHDGPEAIDMSPCFDEILLKFWDIVLLFDMKDKTIAEAFAGEPSLEPYVPDSAGHSIAFADCHTFLTAAYTNVPAALKGYSRK